MDDVTREVLDQTKGLAAEIYKDTLRPSVKPLGEILALFPRTLKLVFSGWEKWLINKEESLRLTAEAIEEKVKQLSEEKIVEPEAYVAIPAIQQLCYCQNNETLRDFYASLLVSSMNADKKWQVHPSFVDIIKQLNPDEAKYLKSMPKMSMLVYPLIDVDFSIDGAMGGHPIITNFTNYNLNVLEHPQNICSYIDNLVRLNIIEIPFGKVIQDSKQYLEIEKHPLIQHPVGGNQDLIRYSYKHKIFKLTNFGVDLLNVVCD